MENKYNLADYDPDSKKNEYRDIFHYTNVANRHLLISAFHRKPFNSAVLGFLFFYWLFQILYQTVVFSTCSNQDITGTETEEEAAVCNRVWHDWVAGMKENESTATRYLTFILGFYVGQMIKRWWEQVKCLPDVDSITNVMAGFIQLEFKDDVKAKDAALELKKKIVRYCLLSWTMCLAVISPPLHEKFKIGENYIEKGLLTEKELLALQVKYKILFII